MITDVEQLLQHMDEEVRNRLATAVEIGKWPDGTKLSDEQRAHAMQAVMLWDSQHGQTEDEPFKVLKGGRLIRQQEKSVKSENSQSNKHQKNPKIDINWQ